MADATIILAGGTGTRLWPASLREYPKQLLRIGGGMSLIQRAISLALEATPRGPVVIVTNRAHVNGIEHHLREIHDSPTGRVVYLPEPVGRNTAPAITLGMTYLKAQIKTNSSVLVLTADHVIGPAKTFARDAVVACRLAGSGNLVCFGIRPDRPETGYGYIRSGARRDGGFLVEAFTEKPDRATAERYLSEGGYFWNAGMFAFTVDGFFSELNACAPEIARAFRSLPEISTAGTETGARSADAEAFTELFSQLPKISIDYALMEKSSRVCVVPASFSWNDVGSWDEAARVAAGQQDGESEQQKGGSGNPEGAAASSGDLPDVIQVEADGNYVDSELPVAICGVSDIHVVVRNGKVLVCRRGNSQLVKKVVETAESTGRDHLL